MSEDIHEGGCLCGAVRYRTKGTPMVGLVCHCRFCQQRLAGAFAVIAYFSDDQVEIGPGPLKEYEHHSDESGRWLKMGFCANCGTTVTHSAELRPGMRAIAAGTFDDPDWFRIDRHVWTRSKLPWVTVPPDVNQFAQGSVQAPATKKD